MTDYKITDVVTALRKITARNVPFDPREVQRELAEKFPQISRDQIRHAARKLADKLSEESRELEAEIKQTEELMRIEQMIMRQNAIRAKGEPR
ncbi:hypothetical protein ACFQZO_23995 [Bradyrhizobium sp. GCM10027634]|uniref:hypothetical protein n=1 Tax=unclassified Bradyrhizobium TaxID=2631580 RepID=UPI00188A7F43|nr:MULTISPECIES: hypothetical protein [unclassified Bradyrhizobium]MDN5003903.1 hypothetical protein [Bradyrhizobium sp. WYCCWR 12677]QOZ45436.1 hypothetical protein XH89_19560 [Bradyrhizobium sp. CCBAU 53340]